MTALVLRNFALWLIGPEILRHLFNILDLNQPLFDHPRFMYFASFYIAFSLANNDFDPHFYWLL